MLEVLPKGQAFSVGGSSERARLVRNMRRRQRNAVPRDGAPPKNQTPRKMRKVVGGAHERPATSPASVATAAGAAPVTTSPSSAHPPPPHSPRLMCCCPSPWPSSLARHHPRRVRLHPLHLRIRLSAPARRWGAPSSPPCFPLGRRRRMMPAIRPSNMGLGYQLTPWAGASSPFCHSPLFRRRHLLRAVAFMGTGVFMEGGRLLVKFLFVACGYRKHVSSHHLAPIAFLAPPIRVPSSYTAITAERSSINRTLRLQEADGRDDRTGTAARSVRLCAS